MSSSQYTAFISYRHQTPDQEIAKKLHQMIETYTVPAALRQDGARHPGKVFRDQEELPLSADLGRDIEAALDNSDWLICICSPRYLQSKWCLRELEYFIEHKGRDRVLAVLVEGEPEDSFPELLRFETDENGNRKEREPLAANVRGESLADNLKKLKKEKYRILAPIVGTSFDGLYQRARRRTMRNIMAAALATVAVLGGFLAYALVQNGKITAQNEQITAQNERISAQNDELTEKNEQIEKANQELTEKNEQIEKANEDLSKANDEITVKNKEISDKNDELTEKNEQIEKANQELTEKNEQIEKANEDLSKANDEITAKNKEISEKNDELTEKNEQIEKANQELTEKNEQIEKANQDLTEANEQITAQNKEISEKNVRIEEERATAARNECDLLTEKSVYYSSINRKNEATKLALSALDVSETVDGYGKSEGMEALAVSCFMGDFAVDAELEFPGFVNYDPSCILSPDGKKIAVVDSRSGLSLCDAVTGDRLWVSTPFSHEISSVHWNADSTKLVVTVMWGHMVCIIDAATGEHLQELHKVFEWPCNAIFDGDNVLVAFSKGIVVFQPDSEDGVFPWPIQIQDNQHITSRSFLNDRYI
ncbi:MAG: TIR domain-containing protein, partial [Clostridia bacterium]|nr:TIR domain-containing protein [Clostridia bacterium]